MYLSLKIKYTKKTVVIRNLVLILGDIKAPYFPNYKIDYSPKKCCIKVSCILQSEGATI
jgi:hypothetical protein